MKSIALKGNKRSEIGSTDAKTLRQVKKIPAVLYGGKENIHFSVDEISFDKIINSPDVYFVNLDIDGTSFKAIIKDVQYHPTSDKALHVDFLEVIPGKSVTLTLPIKVTGSSKAILAGGKLRIVTRRLRVRGLAEALPEFIPIDITELAIGQAVKVADLKVSGLTFLDASNAVVVAIKMSRAAISATTEDAPAAAPATA
ncbi:MAG: 50S ribosomal protein L25 [Flavobacteriales bacterium]|nr:50S ribosomal protein L25 [Flavobacteriales bacterium]